MVDVTIKSDAGAVHRIEAREGESLMEAALRNGIEGIVAECGGECSCATCHVYVDAAFIDRLAPASAEELDLLDFVAAERKTNSRLSCQIKMSGALDGMQVTLPDTQIL